MEPQPETALATATALVCGTALSTTATELNLTGVRADDRAAFSALPELVNLRTLILSNSRFFDEGWAELMTALRKCPRLARLEMAGCGLGPKHAGDLADFLSDATQVTSLCCGSNPAMVGELSEYGGLKTPDVHIEALQQLLDALKPSAVTDLDISAIGIGPTGVGRVADYIRDAKASLALVNIAFNKIGGEGGAALVEALKNSSVKFLGIGKQFQSTDGTLITRSLVQTGVNLFLARRVGEVIEIYKDDPDYITMKWEDDGSESDYISINTMDGEPLNLPLQSNFQGTFLDLSHQQLDPGYVKILAWWLTTPFKASIVTINISQSKIGVEGGQAIVEALKTTTLESIVIGNDLTLQLKGELESDSFDASGQSIDPGYAMIMAWWLTTPVTASVTTLVLDECELSGTKIKYKGEPYYEKIEQLDADLSGFEALCLALASSQIVTLSLKKCYLGPQAIALLANATSKMASPVEIVLDECPLTGATKRSPYSAAFDENIDKEMDGLIALCTALGKVKKISLSKCGLGPASMGELAKALSDANASITYLDVSGCNSRGHEEVRAQLMTAANEIGRVRLRAYQVLAFSEVMHERLGSSCTIDAVGDVCSRVADKMRQLHGHEALCSRLVDCGQTWFKVVIRG